MSENNLHKVYDTKDICKAHYRSHHKCKNSLNVFIPGKIIREQIYLQKTEKFFEISKLNRVELCK